MSMNEERDRFYMQRCFDLARLGAGRVSPNPMVGAVLVYENRVIGEGFHRVYGRAHAEVNAINSVRPADRPLISKSTLYVSLEPCCVFGNTPPCTELIIRHRIPRVVISSLDHSPGVAGQGVEQLRRAGVQVETDVLSEAGNRLSAIRNIFVTRERPYVILKYAQTKDGFIARSDGRPFWISNAFSKRLVHKWRSESDAILVSARTALLDNPQLTNRFYFGPTPRRIILDRRLELTDSLFVFDQAAPTIIVHEPGLVPARPQAAVEYLPVLSGTDLSPLLKALHHRRISTLLVEGGARILQSFIDQQCWDEARVFEGDLYLTKGIPAPRLPTGPTRKFTLDSDQLWVCYPS